MKIFEDKIKKAALAVMKHTPRGFCPDDEALAAFVDTAYREDRDGQMLSHLARCPACRETVLTLRRLAAEAEREASFRVPVSALEKAGRLDPSRKGMMEVVVRFAKGLAEVVKMSGGVVGGLAPASSQVRGEGKVVSETLVTFTKEFEPYKVEVDIERVRPDRGEISVRLSEKSGGSAPPGVRVSLYENSTELESALLDAGQAVFENLKFGRYRVELSRVGEPIGGITLEMKGEGR